MSDTERTESSEDGDEGDRRGDGGRSITQDDRMERRALSERLKGKWNIPEDKLPKIVARQIEIATSGKFKAREAARSAAVLVAMQRQDNDLLMKAIDKEIPDQHEHLHHVEELQAALAKAREDEQYVELERRRALTNGRVAGLNGHNGKPGPMANGSAPRAGR